MTSPLNLPTSYDHIAAEYTARIANELQHKPFDREQLNHLAQLAPGPICDLGCGPGHIAAYLRDQGAAVLGLDISPGMVAQAQQRYPDIHFRQGNMSALDLPDDSWGGIAAFYSIIHIPRDQILPTLIELKRVLRPSGYLLLAFHLGHETIHAQEMWGIPVAIDFNFLDRLQMENHLTQAGFTIITSLERDPYPPAIEHQSRRAYILAQKPPESPPLPHPTSEIPSVRENLSS